MHNKKIEEVNTPVLKLFFADGGYSFFIVERTPQLRDDEQLRAFDYAFFDSSSNSLARFGFVAIVCWKVSRCMS